MVKNLKLSKKLSTIDKSKLILGIAGLTVLVTAAIVVPVVVTNYRVSTLKEHDPIIIWGDSDFDLYDFPGKGTEKNPYRIKKLNITTDSDVGISIWNTTKYFVIDTCYVNTNGTGIQLRSIAPDTAVILDSITESNPDYGIFVYDIPRIALLDNICIENNVGIHVDTSENAILVNNVCIGNNYGISLVNSENSVLTDNILDINEYAIYTHSSGTSIFVDNSCTNNTYGIFIEESDSNQLIENICVENDYGIYLKASNGSLLTLNVLTSNLYGMFFEDGVNNSLIHFNEIVSNSEYGVYILDLNFDNLIHHNNFIMNGNSTTSQAFDNGLNTWFDVSSLGGNFWDDYIGYGNYQIDGLVGAEDLAPLDGPA